MATPAAEMIKAFNKAQLHINEARKEREAAAYRNDVEGREAANRKIELYKAVQVDAFS